MEGAFFVYHFMYRQSGRGLFLFFLFYLFLGLLDETVRTPSESFMQLNFKRFSLTIFVDIGIFIIDPIA